LRVFTVSQILEALRVRGRTKDAEHYEKMIRSNFADHVPREEILQLTIDEVVLLMRINTLLKGSETQKQQAADIIEQIYTKAGINLTPNNNSNDSDSKCGGGQVVFGSVDEYADDLRRRGFMVQVNRQYQPSAVKR
jgi:hypothetical protein